VDTELAGISVTGLRRLFAARELSPAEFMRATLEWLDAVNPELNAFITVGHEQALAQAEAAGRLISQQGEQAWQGRPLLGVPVSVKDLTPTKGMRTTRGSLLWRDWVPTQDAPAVARLRAAGAIVIGKTNTSEFGWSGASHNRLVGATPNPWDITRTAGGSSGGAAAAVAMGLGVAATGTDGAGSIRIPAAFCGVVGFKPSFGRVPYAPASPENLSHLGPLSRTVDDAALLLQVMAGPDPVDPYSLEGDTGGEPEPGRRLRIAWVPSLGRPAPEPGAERLARVALAALADAGHTVEEIVPPLADPYQTLVTILAAAEAAGLRGSPPQARALADPERLKVAERGQELSGADVMAAYQRRAELWQQVHRRMRGFDLLATPTVPVAPFAAGAHAPDEPVDKGELPWLAWTPGTYSFNLTGQPAISLPAGLTESGWPAGLQLVGGWRADATVLWAARELERRRPWQQHYRDLAHRWATRTRRYAVTGPPAASAGPALGEERR
jgi:aspartyl-tRNA(Asn)/glutamyl-tRNA(Gln) amidotransferase subunit A